MSIDTPPIPPAGEPRKKNKLLWGCLIALVLVLVIICCGTTLVLMPLFSDMDPLGIGLRDRIEEYLPLEYLEDLSSIPGLEDLLEEETGFDIEEVLSEAISEDLTEARDIPLAGFDFIDIGTSFVYPVGWDIAIQGYEVAFYHPENYAYLSLGEDITDSGTLAEDIAVEIIDSVAEEAEEGSFKLISSTAYSVSIAEDAHLSLFEWVDLDGYYTWAYDLEIVSGESNLYIFLIGYDPDEIPLYGDLLDIIASSLELMPEIETSGDPFSEGRLTPVGEPVLGLGDLGTVR
ncbi:MAG: hypothetical protein DRI46_10595 [Chloroflexi bacterium]|nr:MAG: hypothetical protein DRI46_10595 [Chloroflexota bacterium]